ncbi:Cu-Zn family superoxide dismutase [Elusimicrobium posterum]|uniref:superoxide dismutase family protein n=1 Tax=Elusimicrobium posterum TaxID=3116653 RepID=UPI003C755EF3
MSKKILLLVFVAAAVSLTACASKNTITVPMYSVNAQGLGEQAGTVKIKDSENGLVFKVNVKNVPASPAHHGFHIHENPSCLAKSPDGKTSGPALAAGGHYDPQKTGAHLGPLGKGHKGDLPFINSDSKGRIKATVTAPRLRSAEVKNRALMIHAGGDNYLDAPDPLGGGGARIICGVIE